MTRKKKTTIRIFPESWVETCDFRMFFPSQERPLEVDIGSGKGRFLLARSGRFPEINFLGIERQLIRVNRRGRKCELAGRKKCTITKNGVMSGIMRSVTQKDDASGFGEYILFLFSGSVAKGSTSRSSVV